MKIPDNGRLVQKRDVIARRVSVKSRHALLQKHAGLHVFFTIGIIIQRACNEEECPLNKLLFQPVITLAIFPLESHIDRQRLITHC